MIETSLDWAPLRDKLLKDSRDTKHYRDIQKMVSNISRSVTDLSRAEVDYRRGKKHRACELLEKINQDIETVQEFIVVANLIG
jgi:hypothetical protein